MHVGKTYWVARGTRGDCSHTVHIMSTHLRDWSEYDDEMVFRLYTYLKATAMMGLV